MHGSVDKSNMTLHVLDRSLFRRETPSGVKYLTHDTPILCYHRFSSRSFHLVHACNVHL